MESVRSAVRLAVGHRPRQVAAVNLRRGRDYLATMRTRPRSSPRHSAALIAAIALLLSACGGAPKVATAPTPAVQPADTLRTVQQVVTPPAMANNAPPPLGEFASRKVVVFPLQKYAVGDSGWINASSSTGRPRAAQVDSALTAVLRERGLDGTWSLAPNTSRVAQREVMNRTDPRNVSTAGLMPGKRPNDIDLREPLASQLRAIIAMVPDSRLVLLPLEVRVRATPTGQKQATLRIAFLDGRMATVLSFPDVVGPTAADERSAVTGVAAKFADLVVKP